MKYNLTSNLIFFSPVKKLKYTNNCKDILDFTYMGLFLICQGMGDWVVEQYDSLREKLLVIDARAIYFWLLFFVGMTFHTKKINSTLTI